MTTRTLARSSTLARSATLAVATALLALAAPTTRAASFAASSASSGTSMASQSVGSVSESFKGSSDGSSRGNEQRAAAGDYTVVAVADVPSTAGEPPRVRLTLQGPGGHAAELTLPQVTAAKQGLAVGHAVRVAERAYGLEFAHAASGEAFFLVVEDAVHRELITRRVAG